MYSSSMRTPGLLLVSVIAIAGCRAPGRGPGVAFDLRLLDRAPVVPIQMREGNATGLLRPDGSVLTCSHVVPRGHAQGEVRITGPWIRFSVPESGDHLARTWGDWSAAEPPDPLDDWAILVTDPPIDARQIFAAPLELRLSRDPPHIGETVYLVGYTVEGGRFIRYWVTLAVVPPPGDRRSSTPAHVIWLPTPRRCDGPRG